MFEHLGPVPEVGIYKSGPKYKLYLSSLFLAVLVFIFSFSFTSGPESSAKEPEVLSAQIFVDSSDRQVVASVKNFSVFDFVIKVDNADTSLYKLNILVEGVYDLSLIKDLKLFHDNVQLGQIETIDSSGKIYFDLVDYKLKVGQNNFSLFFSSSASLKDSPALKFSIPTKDDIFLISGGEVFRPTANWPVTSGLISVSDHGQLLAANAYAVNDFIINSNVPQPVSSFELGSLGEQADLRQIVLSYQTTSGTEDSEAEFFLAFDQKPIAQAKAKDGQIVFDIKPSVVLEDLSRKKFELYTFALPEGTYKFSLDKVSASGAWSGETVLLAEPVLLSQPEVRPYFVEFKTGDLDQKLSPGWNKIYDLVISSRGADQLYLHKLTWDIDYQNLDISKVELWYNGQPYIADLILQNGQLIVKTNGQEPLSFGKLPAHLVLLANIENIKDRASIQAWLLPDDGPLDQDNIFGHIIWSDGQDFYNGYQMPYLPLAPSILSN